MTHFFGLPFAHFVCRERMHKFIAENQKAMLKKTKLTDHGWIEILNFNSLLQPYKIK